MLGNALAWISIPFINPQYISGYEKVKITTTNRMTTMETAQRIEILTYQIVIFGAAGDLAVKKLIPALFKLHQKDLLPGNLVIVGTSRRRLTNLLGLKSWVTTLRIS